MSRVLIVLFLAMSTASVCTATVWVAGVSGGYMKEGDFYEFEFSEDSIGIGLNVGYVASDKMMFAVELRTEEIRLAEEFNGEDTFAWWTGAPDSFNRNTVLAIFRYGLSSSVTQGLYLEGGVGATRLGFTEQNDQFSGTGTVGVFEMGYSHEVVSGVSGRLGLNGMVLNAETSNPVSVGIKVGAEYSF